VPFNTHPLSLFCRSREHRRKQERSGQRRIAAFLEQHAHVEHPESGAAEFLRNDQSVPSEVGDLPIEVIRHPDVIGHDLSHMRCRTFPRKEIARAVLELLLFFGESEIHFFNGL
jgi:hypothetical protein